MDSSFIGKDHFIWWKGVVEDRKDPIMLGRVKVRIFGWHSEDPQQIATEDLPWASVSSPADSGRNPIGLKEGDWVWGFFMDGPEAQKPIVVGMIPGIDEKQKPPELGFGDPTKPGGLTPNSAPRPPDIKAQTTEPDATESSGGALGRYANPDKPPGTNIAFGEIYKNYNPLDCKFDINGDGVFNWKDALLIMSASLRLFGQKFFNGLGQISSLTGNWMSMLLDGAGNLKTNPDNLTEPAITSPYPLADRLMEPTTSRLARNENIEDTIIGLKQNNAGSITTAAFDGTGVGTQGAIPPQVFDEPPSPYDAKYPFNHVYESESGHFIEVDDSPGAERLHWYHRSGTFREIHPDGTQVTKVKKTDYNFVIEDYFCASEKTINFSAKKGLTAKADDMITLESGASFNRKVGEDDNLSVAGNTTARVKGSSYNLIEDESWTHVTSGAYVCVKGGDLQIMVKGNVLVDAEGSIQLKSKDTIKLCAPNIIMQGHGGGLTTVEMVSMDIRTLWLKAHTSIVSAMIDGQWLPKIPFPAIPAGTDGNRAGEEAWYEEDTEDSPSNKYGFVLPGAPEKTVWKPVSDSTGNLVTLSQGQGAHQLFEAIPTGMLESVKIAYEHPDMQRTEWEIVRPIHTLGKEVTNIFGAPISAVFEGDGRPMYRWPAPGAQYPKQLFLVIGGATAGLILDSAVRHQSSMTGFTLLDEKLPYDLSKPGPEADAATAEASEKYGYLFPRGTVGDVYKPTSESNGNLVTLSEAGDDHELYEAVETDVKEVIKIKYLNKGQTITEWVVTRPVFKRGNLIERASIKMRFIDGKRWLCRFSKPGASYPKNMFLVIKNNGVIVTEHFIIESSARHQHTITYNEKVAKNAEQDNT